MSMERPPSQEQKLRMYRDEVIGRMYPKKGKGMTLPQAVEKVLANRGITDRADLAYYMREIGRLIKKGADEKRKEQEQFEKEPIKEKPRVEFWQQRENERVEKLKGENPLFADQIEQEERRHFN